MKSKIQLAAKTFSWMCLGLFLNCSNNNSTNDLTKPGNDSTSAPVVVSTLPSDQAINVPVDARITFIFSQPMAAGVTQTAISSTPAITGTFIWDLGDTKMTWVPSTHLLKNTKYNLTLTTAALSKAAKAMTTPKSISFTTDNGSTSSTTDTTGTSNLSPGQLKGAILRKEDSGAVSNANVVLFNAKTNTPLLRTTSGLKGEFQFTIDSGDYFLTATAPGRLPAPPPTGKATPFHITPDSIKIRNIYMRKDSSGDTTGGISGIIRVSDGSASQGGILVIATGIDSTSYSTTTGPDGYYIFNNLPVGVYTIKAFRSGLWQDTLRITATVLRDNITTNHSFDMGADTIRKLTGKITFLATKNGVTDITLVDQGSRTPIPGLGTLNEAGLTYQILGIPPGTYIAWASYLNDGYVMDPDAIRKFGLPVVTFAKADSLKTQDFDVTGAIPVISPTNPANSLSPAPIKSLSPYFVWDQYPSAKQYIIEVRDQSGAVIWGGWDSTGKILHAPILPHGQGLDSVQFNFDSSAVELLKVGGSYAWKIYADFFNKKDVGQLISASEDLRGLFMSGVDSIPVGDTTEDY